MLHTAASAAVARVRRFHVLLGGAALVLCCFSLLLHGQLQVHSQLKAAHNELGEIKAALAASGPDSGGAHHPYTISSGSSSSDGGAPSTPGLVQNLVHIVKEQQQLLKALEPRGSRRSNEQLKQHIQQLAEQTSALLGPAADGTGLLDSNGTATAAMQHTRHHPQVPATPGGRGAVAGGDASYSIIGSGGTARSNDSVAAAAAVPPGTLCLDLTQFLGLPKFVSGITWEPRVSENETVRCCLHYTTIFATSAAISSPQSVLV